METQLSVSFSRAVTLKFDHKHKNWHESVKLIGGYHHAKFARSHVLMEVVLSSSLLGCYIHGRDHAHSALCDFGVYEESKSKLLPTPETLKFSNLNTC